MLDQELKSQLKTYFEKLDRTVTLAVGAGEHPQQTELLAMLNDLAEASEFVQVRTDREDLPSPVSFRVLSATDETDTGIVFSGVPGGHEFSSLVLAVLQAGGVEPRLDAGIRKIVGAIDEPMVFQTIVSLECHNCPEVVQTLNSFSLLNPAISHEMIDGALFPELIARRKVQGVPAVFLNGEPFASGKLDAGGLVEKLLARAPVETTTEPAASSPGTANEAEKKPYDVLIVGGGPAGVAAAVYSARKGLHVGMVGDRIGGQVKDTMDIENLVAVLKTTGPTLSRDLSEQLRSHDIDLREHLRVKNVTDGPLKTVTLTTGESLRAKTVIISTGAKWRELGVPGEKENIGRGVAYCPHCDGPFFKNKDVAVIGGGNSGVEAALDLAGIVRSVKLLEFGPAFNADRVLLDRARATTNIELIAGARTDRIESDDEGVTGLIYTDRASDRQKSLALSGVFIQIGLLPNSSFVDDLLEMNASGEIVVDEKCRTNLPGVFACGDVTDTPYKQIVIALGEGAKASLAAFEYLLQIPETSRGEGKKLAS